MIVTLHLDLIHREVTHVFGVRTGTELALAQIHPKSPFAEFLCESFYFALKAFSGSVPHEEVVNIGRF